MVRKYYCIGHDCNNIVSGLNKRCNSCAGKKRWQDKEFRKKNIEYYFTKKFLLKEYVKNRKSKQQLAKELNCSTTPIHNGLIKYNIPIRTLSEAGKGRISWSKGLTKETDKRIKKIGEKTSKGNKGRKINLKGRKNISLAKIGNKNPSWKGGRYIGKDGYVTVRVYPKGKNHKGKKIKEHRLVMEKYLGRKLKTNELSITKMELRMIIDYVIFK